MQSIQRKGLKLAALALAMLPSLCLVAQPRDVIKVSQIADARKQAWTTWCNELARKDTLARMSTAKLEAENTCQWTLPEALEPKAVMNFYSGTKGEKPAEGYPAFVYLHGSGPRQIEWMTGLKLSQAFEDAPSLYIIPQIPNEGQFYRWWQQSKQWAWGHLLRQLLAHPDVDPSRLYLFGISEGGYGSQRLASFYADYLAGAAPMAGGEPLRNAPAENLCRTAFSLVTGEKDAMFFRNQLTMRTMERLDSLKKDYPGEYNHRVMLEPEKGHAISYGVSTPWLKTFRREAQPRHFRWENYEMDGLKRNCFYNLEVLEEDAESSRIDYDFSIQNNVVKLNVRRVEYIITKTDPQWGIELDNTRRYEPAQHGKLRIYLSEELANLSKPIKLYINGKQLSSQKLVASKETMRRSLELFGDPLRIFPTFVEVEW